MKSLRFALLLVAWVRVGINGRVNVEIKRLCDITQWLNETEVQYPELLTQLYHSVAHDEINTEHLTSKRDLNAL